MKVGIVDYDAGNLKSVETALAHLGHDFVTSDRPEVLERTDRLVFPGVGEAASAIKVLRKRKLDAFLREYVSHRPMIGICLGSQILFERSEERDARGLGLLPGVVRKFPRQAGLKVPHMGWNNVWHRGRHRVFEGIPDGASFYFVHSYYIDATDSDFEIADTEYGVSFTSGVASGLLVAFQFHPEKSGPYGLRLLQNFFELPGV